MDHTERRKDPWAFPTFFLWMLLLIAGLFPEDVFHYLQDAGRVVTQKAMVNSPGIISVALCVYITAFVHQKTLEATGQSDGGIALLNSAAAAVLALLAFLPLTLQQVQETIAYGLTPNRRLIIGLATVKVGSWLYLYFVFMTYYLLGKTGVFARPLMLFPRRSAPARTLPDPNDTATAPSYDQPGHDSGAR